MNTHSSRSLPNTFFRNSLSFAVAFVFLYLLYCLLDNFRNPRLAIYQGNSVWSNLVIDPTVAALGVGALILGFKADRRRALFSALAVFLASLLFFRLWIWFLPLDKLITFNPNVVTFFIYLHEVCVGLITGAMIGYTQGDWKRTGWYALAGALGFTIGFLLMDIAGRTILALSPFGLNLPRLIVGSPWFYLYFMVPAFIQGLTLGLSIAFAGIVCGRSEGTTTPLNQVANQV